MKHQKSLFIASLLILAGMQIVSAQVCQSEEMAFKVKQEAFSNSQIRELSEFMTDLLGSRLEGSQMKLRAEKLVEGKLAEYGLSNARIEFATEFTRGGWDVEKTYAAMTSPYYCAFSVNPKAWSGSTDGLVKAECIIFDAQTAEDLEKYKGKVAGKILLIPANQQFSGGMHQSSPRYSDEELEALKSDSRASIDRRPMTYMPTMSIDEFRKRMKFRETIAEFMNAEKAVCSISSDGEYNIPGASGAAYKAGDPEPLPQLLMPAEDHGRMCRLIRSGQKVEMEIELKNVFTDNQKVNNVIAEIPGTDPKLKDEVVLIGAHLDSWHGSTGAADDASGCIVMMEAMRILKTIGVKPKRTIRIALWGGEEQGLFGSSGYSDKYLYDKKAGKALPGFDKFALYLNMDNGSGRFRGIYLERNDLAVPYFEAWMKPIESLGFNVLSPQTTGGTDHLSFDRIGLPAYQFIQDMLEYDRTYHTIMDTYERLSLNDLQVDACITAWLVLCAADDPGRIPVKPGYPAAAAQQRGMMPF